MIVACCVFAAYMFGLLWRGTRAVAGWFAVLLGRRIAPEEDPVAPMARRSVVVPRELRPVPGG